MFSLHQQQTKITSFTPRMEKHGDENVLAGTLKLESTVHSSVLDNFDKSLRKLLYRKPAAGEQADLPLGDSDGLTARKLPHLQEAHQHFLGKAFDGAHGALADAQACARVYYALNPVAAVA